jgi:pimeloyl-ACP methyl ester carboxylesterase
VNLAWPWPVIYGLGSLLLLTGLFLLYVYFRYSHIVARILEQAPPLHPLRVDPEPGAEEVIFRTSDGIALTGSYLPRRTKYRRGVLIFCHEFLSDRWSARSYVDDQRDYGYDLFTFDFRNHGDSESEPGHEPLQWVSDRDLLDLEAACRYLERRPDRDAKGWAIFGVSRGGGAALCLAAREPRIWAIATDGAFGTRSTMLAYILRWAEIYVGFKWLYRKLPRCFFDYAGWVGRVRSQAKLDRRYLDVETAVSRLAPRPWLAIHGEKDVYIGVEIAEDLFRRAREPKELWIVPDAKHNQCLDADPAEYHARVRNYLARFAPPGPQSTSEQGPDPEVTESEEGVWDSALVTGTNPREPV